MYCVHRYSNGQYRLVQDECSDFYRIAILDDELAILYKGESASVIVVKCSCIDALFISSEFQELKMASSVFIRFRSIDVLIKFVTGIYCYADVMHTSIEQNIWVSAEPLLCYGEDLGEFLIFSECVITIVKYDNGVESKYQGPMVYTRRGEFVGVYVKGAIVEASTIESTLKRVTHLKGLLRILGK